MSSPRARTTAALFVSLVGALSVAGQASAATAFGCRASVTAVRPATLLPTMEPYVGQSGCHAVRHRHVGGDGRSDRHDAIAGPAGAYTYSSASATRTLVRSLRVRRRSSRSMERR